jgi:hypothetical protein
MFGVTVCVKVDVDSAETGTVLLQADIINKIIKTAVRKENFFTRPPGSCDIVKGIVHEKIEKRKVLVGNLSNSFIP